MFVYLLTIKTTRWSPDTCGCVIEYEWDDTLSEANRTHTVSNFINVCNANSTGNIATKYDTCLEENQFKNICLDLCLTNGPSTLYDVQSDNNQTLKNTIVYNFSWSATAPNRVLTISFTDVTVTNVRKTAMTPIEQMQYTTYNVSDYFISIIILPLLLE